MCDSSDTIVAVSTAAGRSPRAIVRLSGPRAIALLESLLDAPNPRLPAGAYLAAETTLRMDGLRVPARLYIMRAPASYTREDIAEIHTFGNPALLRALLDELGRLGARPAAPGEFTRRAFLNGRIDLAQAEAVEALIRARDEGEHRAALDALDGRLSRRWRALSGRLADEAARAEAALDFSDQDVPTLSLEEARGRLRPLRDEILALLAGREEGRVARHAARIVLIGPPNAGKSSLFNSLLRRRRAIVSPRPGTTRDTVEALAALDGQEAVLADTAGLREAQEEVEALAVARARQSVRRADVALCVLDAAEPLPPKTRELLAGLDPARVIVALNKSDLGPPLADVLAALPAGVETLAVSAVTGAGVSELAQRLRRRIEAGGVARAPAEAMVNARHAHLLRQAAAALERALAAETLDLAADDLRESLLALSGLNGGAVTEDVLDRIFAAFCIGK